MVIVSNMGGWTLKWFHSGIFENSNKFLWYNLSPILRDGSFMWENTRLKIIILPIQLRGLDWQCVKRRLVTAGLLPDLPQ